MQKIRVGVIYGGRSVEHEVSIISALQAMGALDKSKYQAVPIYISKQGIWYTGEALMDINKYRNMDFLLKESTRIYFSQNNGDYLLVGTETAGMFKKQIQEKIDIAIPVIHGTHGEDGSLQGLLELSGIPYAGPGVLSGAIGMDKIVMKAVLKEAGLPVPDYLGFYYWQWQDDEEGMIKRLLSKLDFPLIVKPANLGSSIGITKVNDEQQLKDAVALAASFSNRLIVEKVIQPLREINCAVLGSPQEMEVSLCEEPVTAEEILSFQDKYLHSGKGMSGATRRIPADLTDEQVAEFQDLARRAFTALDGYGVCRIDFLMDSDSGKIYVNEANTIPGSLSFYLWEPKGKSFSMLMDELCRLALKRSRTKEKMIFSYSSNILSQGGFKGGKK